MSESNNVSLVLNCDVEEIIDELDEFDWIDLIDDCDEFIKVTHDAIVQIGHLDCLFKLHLISVDMFDKWMRRTVDVLPRVFDLMVQFHNEEQ